MPATRLVPFLEDLQVLFNWQLDCRSVILFFNHVYLPIESMFRTLIDLSVVVSWNRSLGDLLTSGCFTFVAVLTLQFSSDSAAQHNLYVKEHKVRAEKSSQRPMDRTLFVLNIPPYCSEVHPMSLGNFLF